MFPAAVCVFVFLAVQGISGDGVQLQVTQGTLAGEILKAVPHGKPYYSFKGIPYAKPPVGNLRFKDPQPPLSWEGVRNATAHGPVCPQVNILTNIYTPGDEDCLFLNVYTPALTPAAPLPVIFYIFGGSFRFGSGDVDLYGPDFIVAENVVLVTINHRLDSLGHLSLGNCEVPGNAALKDQVAALKWVRDNIKNFGGDPYCVTIMGGASGGTSVAYHLVSQMSKGLFHRAILSSGAPSNDWAYSYQPERTAFTLGQILGLDTKNKTELLNFLQEVPTKDLVNTTAFVLASEEKTSIPMKIQPFTPTIEKKCPEGNFITEDSFELLESCDVNKVDVMCGYNSQETVILIEPYVATLLEQYKRYPELFVPSKILLHSKPNTILEIADKIIEYYFGEKSISVNNIAEFINYANNASISYDVQRFIRRWPKVGNTYFYKFSSYSSRNNFGQAGAKYNITGAAHFDEVFYLFDSKSLNMTLDTDSTEYKMIQHFTKAVTNFAKYGNPTPDSSLGVTWPLFDSNLEYVDFGEELTVKSAPDDADYHFWGSIFHHANLPF